MKTTILAAAMIATAGFAQAADINVAGQTLSIGGEFDANYTTGVETFAIDLTKSVGIVAYGVDFSAEHKIDVLRLNEDGYDLWRGVDFEAGYSLSPSLRTYGKVNMDKDFDFGDVTVGASFAF